MHAIYFVTIHSYIFKKKYNSNLGIHALIMYFYCMFIDMINGAFMRIYVFLLVPTMF